MLQTKLNRPKISNDLLIRQRLIEKLEKNKQQPLILISAPAGYGKSMLVSQWLEQCENKNVWISLDQSMSDSAAFISYFTETIKRCSSVEMPELKNPNQDYLFLSWESIIDIIINTINGLKDPIWLVLDDYHLIRNQEIHMLIDAIISENINNFHLVIITRRDPPLQLRELRLYQKMLELRIRDLRFNEDEITELLATEHNTHFSKDEISELFNKTEGWILAIRIIVKTRSLLISEDRNLEKGFLTSDLDILVDHIGENLETDFFKQVQLCSLFDQFNEDLIDSVFTHVFKDSGKAGSFLAKLKDLNLFLIATKDKGSWFRFHHLFGDILRRRLERNEPNIINPLFIHISSWFASKGLIDEAIQYAIKAKKFGIAADLIIEHSASKFALGEWWVVKRWLENIPEKIRMNNVDILLIELFISEETFEIKELSILLDTLEAIGVENFSTKNQSLYLCHLGYYLIYIRPNPEKALEYLEQSKSLYHDETSMFGARREIMMATTLQMLGRSTLALKHLDDIDKNFKYESVMHIRLLQARIYVLLLSGNFNDAVIASEKFHFIAKKSESKILRAWSLYLIGNSAFQTSNMDIASQSFKEVIDFDGVINYRISFDALAGLILLNSLKGDTKTAESLLNTMELMTAKLKNSQFRLYTRSVKARVNLHKGLGSKELEWAQMNWAKQTHEPYLWLMDVPDLTKICIIVNHGTTLQVEEALVVLAEVEVFLDSVHNKYHALDIELLKAMALLRIGRKEHAKESLNKALTLAEKNDSIRPIIEAYRVMPSLFELVDQSFTSRRLLSRIGLKSSNNELQPVSDSKSHESSFREQQVIH